MKNLGQAGVIFGMKLITGNDGISLTLSHSTNKVLNFFEYFDVTPISISYDSNVHFKKNLDEPISQNKYAKIIGSFFYISNRTRPRRHRRYTSNQRQQYQIALERIFKYLKDTLYYYIFYSGFSTVI